MPEADRSSAKTLRVLLEWFQKNKITYNKDAIDVVVQQQTRRGSNIVSTGGLGVVAKRDLQMEEPLVVIPKNAVISPATGALANIFEDEEMGGSLALCISVMYEMAQGNNSPWYGYLQSLPKCADIPLLWNVDALEWLEGTDVAKWVVTDEKDLRDDFGVLQKLVVKYPSVFVSQNGINWDEFACFLRVTSLVSSRAFMVDEYRGNSMVPFADIFNHLTLAANVHIESEESVCLLCGMEYGCEHMYLCDESNDESSNSGGDEEEDDGRNSDEDGSESWDEAADGETSDSDSDSENIGEELPLLIDKSGNSVYEETQSQSLNGDRLTENNKEEESMSDEEDMMAGTLDMVVYKSCKTGNEVFNTYGDHGSAYLLHRYGFCDAENPFDSVTIDVSFVLQAITKTISEKRATNVSDIIKQFGYMFETGYFTGRKVSAGSAEEDEVEDSDQFDSDEEIDEDTKPLVFTFIAPGHPDPNLAAILVLGLADESVFEQVSHSASVFRQFFPVIRKFWVTFQEKLDSGTSILTAFRVANKCKIVKNSSVGMVCRTAQLLAERRLAQLGDGKLFKQKPSDPLQTSRWSSAKQLWENETFVLQSCIKKYKKVSSKLLAA
ncbi:SET domain-containing protein [Coemansia reversa NRRL 1564]|uniref:SET domain-containing protein n=1 Tax=Coemansia reversa (strain ATCC 12441 / NRRL 1564) TaxID=763665 RepID=A0A2G5BKR4_COERN|nr:SET domain-containing protein [Coemansia reversa NRRL 1564]|eukprot:PIA19562.1 SET domain-containing protein [Coemansia reversa NRRL 1564]